MLGRRGRTREALPALYECLKAHPEALDLWILGSQLALGDPDLRDIALDWAVEARRLHPEERRLKRNHGLALLRADDPVHALACLEEARQGSDDAQGFAELVIAAIAAGRERIPEFPPEWERNLTRSILEGLRTLNGCRAVATVDAFMQRLAAHRDRLPLLAEALEIGA